MQDIQELCSRGIIIDHGAVVFDDGLTASGKVVSFDGARGTPEVPRAQVTGAVLARSPVADIATDEAEAEEIIRQIFTEGVHPAGARNDCEKNAQAIDIRLLP